MSLKVRIIPCLDVDAGRVVKGTNFKDLRDAGDPVELAALYDREGADEIVFYDITASHEQRETAATLARRAAEEVFIPYTIGGGVRTASDMRAMLRAGADKVSVNSAAVRTPNLITEGAERFGSQCVVLSVDVKRRGHSPGWEVYLNGGRVNTGMDAVGWLVEGERRGAGEFVLNSMDADGTESGYDLDLISTVAEKTTLPIVASGGAGGPEHMISAVNAGAGAVLAASIFHFGEYSIAGVKEHLSRAGIPVRLVTSGRLSVVGRPEGGDGMTPAVDTVRFDEKGLVPVVAQDAATGDVLTLAYANREAVEKTLASGEAHYYSRSRSELWRKGATSGNTQRVVEVRLDCDGDALLYMVEPRGPACHTGEKSCFFTSLAGEGVGVRTAGDHSVPFGTMVEQLAGTIAQRHREMPEGSYTASLIEGGPERLAQKVGEEAVEVVIAALSDERLPEEAADLVYHLLVLLEERGVGTEDVARVLHDRHG